MPLLQLSWRTKKREVKDTNADELNKGKKNMLHQFDPYHFKKRDEAKGSSDESKFSFAQINVLQIKKESEQKKRHYIYIRTSILVQLSLRFFFSFFLLHAR